MTLEATMTETTCIFGEMTTMTRAQATIAATTKSKETIG
jgi:hypothetical protein